MYPSTEGAELERQFAVNVLQQLLRHIAIENVKANDRQGGHHVYRVSHAWTDGPLMYVVYESPPSNITWGLVRDTRKSLIDPGPWNDADNPGLYYYMLDFEEGWPGPLPRQPGDNPEIIHWRGDQHDRLPERLSSVSASYRHTPLPISDEEARETPCPAAEPRRYADPRGQLPPDAPRSS